MATRNRTPHFTRLLACLSIGLLVPPAAHAIKNHADEPIHINARSVEADEKTGVAVYRGNVLVEQGPLSIEADRVEIHSRKNKTDLIRATGKPAKLRRRPGGAEEEIRARADRIDYRVAAGELDMTGDVSLRRGEDRFSGEKLHYDLDSKNLTATGNDEADGRVHAVIQSRKPSAETTPAP
jgi:lipopolysaccharide export system protein LptA